MKFNDLVQASKKYNNADREITPERLDAIMPELRKLISYWREYPDKFVDFLLGKDGGPEHFRFYTYQRVFLRAAIRHRYTYFTFPRGFSKSFLTIMILVIRAILYPGAELFVTTGGKEQASSITLAKITEICRLIPPFKKEINFDRGKTKQTKHDVDFLFKNGSKINILAARETSRGQRRTGGVMEECILIDQTALNEIVIPCTNIERRLADGTYDRAETVNKSQVFLTTAGYKNSFAFEKNQELLIQSLIEPDEALVMGGTYEIPVAAGLLNEDFIDELQASGTYNEDSFDREYKSRWSGDAENAFFAMDRFEKNRTLLAPEYEYSIRSSDKSSYYIIGVDVGRLRCTTEICVFKVTPQVGGQRSLKSLVNIYTREAEHFGSQAITLKKLFFKYKARAMIIDANGMGLGLMDCMVMSQIDPETGDVLPPFGVMNDTDGIYKKNRTADTIPNAIYAIKANATINTDIYSYTQMQLQSGKVQLLVPESVAKTKLLESKAGQNMSLEQRNEYLIPFVRTDALEGQTLNLKQENQGMNIILKQSSTNIGKDKFSAFSYGLYLIKMDEDKSMQTKRRNIADLMLFN